MQDSFFSRRNILRNTLIAGGGLMAATSMSQKASAQTSTTTVIVNTFADLATTVPSAAGDIATIKGHTLAGFGGGNFIAKSGSASNNGGTKIPVVGGSFYWERVSKIINFEDFGVLSTNSGAANTPLIQKAIDFTAIAGGTIYGSPSTYTHSGTIVLKNYVNIEGAGCSSNTSHGTTFTYTGTGDGWQINNPINASTEAQLTINSVTFVGLNIGIGRGCFADTGSTQLYLHRCAFIHSSAGCGVIFDQTEVSRIEKCTFYTPQTGGNGACLWVVNGSSRTAGATMFYSNQLSFIGNQFNAAASTARCVVDEGGINHNYVGNNFNGGSHSFEGSALNGCIISENELEGTSNAVIVLGRGSYNQGSSAVVISGNYFYNEGHIALDIASNVCQTLEYNNNLLVSTSLTPIDSILNDSCVSIVAYGNYNRGGGAAPYNNSSLPASLTSLNATLFGTSTTGSNTYSTRVINWDRNGKTVAITGEIALSSLDPSTSGNIKITCLPYKASGVAAITIGMNGYVNLGTGYTNLSAITVPGTKDIELYKYGAGVSFTKVTKADINGAFDILISGIYLCNNVG